MDGKGGNKSGFYRANGGVLERVNNKVIALAAFLTALGVLVGTVVGGARIVQAMEKPAVESITREVIDPIQQHNEIEINRRLEKSDFEAYKALKDAQDMSRDDLLRQIRDAQNENFKYLRDRVDHISDAQSKRGGR